MSAIRLRPRLRRFVRDESGTTLVEFGVCFVVFLLIFFALIDFGRMAFSYVVAEKAMHIAARIAAVRPAACPGVPQLNVRSPSSPTPAPSYGSSCNAGANICAVSTVTCTGTMANPTVSEIWGIVGGRMPTGTSAANLQFTYQSDTDLGFLGGPYVPVVTVEMVNANFNFATPLSGFVALLGGTPDAGLGPAIPFPSMSVSMPGEDLAQGNAG